MVVKAEIRRILADRNIFATTMEGLDDDAELMIDSLAMVWLAHRLEEEHGVRLDPELLAGSTSVNRIHALLAGKPVGKP